MASPSRCAIATTRRRPNGTTSGCSRSTAAPCRRRGEAPSLQGGMLLVTPLLGADGEVYAVSQGPVAIGGFSAGGQGAT
ncbi:MAG: flagellar biosynthesis protein FlgA, partial [Alphaproteobacteria bacterium]|nr:flagellar biosynthesis protein FlgA [Alphaproteobacteria bacterium]